jgi:hypothetical protein
LSAQGISPAKVTATTKTGSEASAKNVEDHKPYEVCLKDDEKEFKLWPDGVILGSILFAILSISCLFLTTMQNRKQ